MAYTTRHYRLTIPRCTATVQAVSIVVVLVMPHHALAAAQPLREGLDEPRHAWRAAPPAPDEGIAPLIPGYRFTEAGSVVAYPSPLTVEATRPISPARVRPPGVVASQTLARPLVLEGEASFYSRAGCLGCDPARIMANGQPLNDAALTMAIGADRKHLVGRRARVTNVVTGQSVEVTITDTGGFHTARYGHRVADLTIATKQAIGMKGGVSQVRVEIF